jgi:uncharacterized protein YutE (UPF0331/DUF86 family)
MKTVILQKLENITNCLSRIESKKPFTLEELKTNYDIQDTISINLQRAIQAAIDLASHIISEKNARTPQDSGDTFVVLSEIGVIDKHMSNLMIKASGFRNAIVHEYDGIDWIVVHTVCEKHLNLFKDFAKTVLKYAVDQNSSKK